MSSIIKNRKELELDINKAFISTKTNTIKNIKLRRALTIMDNNNKLFEMPKLLEVKVVPRYTSAKIKLHAWSTCLHFEFWENKSYLSFTEEEVLNNPHMFIIGK